MISLAGRDILHAWGKFIFTGIGLGLLIGVTLTMAGVYRGMVEDGKVLLDNSGADLWVVQQDTLGPYAESSSIPDDLWRSIRAMPGVAQAANVTYLTMQAGKGEDDVRVMVVGISAGEPGVPGWPPHLVAGRQITRGHYEAVADLATGFRVGDELKIRRNRYAVVGLTRRMVSSSGDPMVFIPLKDAQEAQFLKDNDAILMQRRRTEADPAFNRPGMPGLLDAVLASQTSNGYVNAVLVRIRPGFTPQEVAEWIGAHFAYDSPRSIALSETQRSSGAGFSIHAPDAFFSKPRGVCVDLARFGVETLRSISPELEPAYLMIEFEPTLLGANLLRRHWVASFKRGGKHYFFADSKRPGHIAGPFATTSEFVAEYAHYRGRTILGFKERPTYQRQSKVRARRLL